MQKTVLIDIKFLFYRIHAMSTHIMDTTILSCMVLLSCNQLASRFFSQHLGLKVIAVNALFYLLTQGVRRGEVTTEVSRNLQVKLKLSKKALANCSYY